MGQSQAVSSPLDRSKRFTLFPSPGRPVHSNTNLASPGSILTFKQHLLDIGEGRGDAWANNVALRMAGVTHLPAADAQYHQRCYNAYRKPLLTPAECAPLISDTALSSVNDDMDCNWKQTWTVADLYKLYQEYDGKLSSN